MTTSPLCIHEEQRERDINVGKRWRCRVKEKEKRKEREENMKERGSREGSNLCGVERVSREDVEVIPETLKIKSVEPQPHR